MTPVVPFDVQGNQAAAYLSWTDASGAPQVMIFDLVESEEWGGGSTLPEHPVEIGANITDNIRVQLRTCQLKVIATNEPIDGNNWSGASPNPQTLSLPSFTVPPATSTFSVPRWDNQLELRALATTAGGAVGSALGGAAGNSALGGAVGAVVGSAIAGSLLEGKVVHDTIQTNVSSLDNGKTSGGQAQVTTLGFDDPDDFVGKTIQQLETFVATGQTIDVMGTKTSCIGTFPGIGGMAIESLTHVRAKETGTGASIMIGFREIRVVATETVPAPAATVKRATPPVKKGNQNTGELAQAAEDAANAAVQGFNQGESDLSSLLSGSP